MKRRLMILSSTLILFTSCSTVTIGNLNEYEPIQLEMASVKVADKKMTIVIFDLDDRFNKLSKESRLGFAISNELKSKLVQTKQTEVIRRDVVYSDLPEERMRFKEDFNSAQYLLMGKITEAKYKKRFHPPQRNQEGGYLESFVIYGACIRGSINLLKLPSMIMRESFDFDECSQEIASSISPQNMKNSNPELLRKNITGILDDIVPKMQKYFRPQGYIRGMRKNGKKIIIETTLSSNLGAISGRDVEILRLEQHHDEIKDKDYTIERKIGEGEVTNNITEEYSFIMINSLSENPKIGDIVKVSK